MTYESFFCGKEKAEKVLLKVLRIDFLKRTVAHFALQQNNSLYKQNYFCIQRCSAQRAE